MKHSNADVGAQSNVILFPARRRKSALPRTRQQQLAARLRKQNDRPDPLVKATYDLFDYMERQDMLAAKTEPVDETELAKIARDYSIERETGLVTVGDIEAVERGLMPPELLMMSRALVPPKPRRQRETEDV